MDALVHKDPGRAAFAKSVVFTENDVAMPIGEGLWGTISGASAEGLELADPSTGQAAWFGLVYEHGQPAYYAMRLRVQDGKIAEVETVVDRQTGLPSPFGDPKAYTHDPAFAEVLPPEQRRPRERLRAVADSYFSTVELNDGTVFAPFDPDCARTENGISTTRGGAGAASIAQGCEAQFKLGIYRINKRVRERRYALIDEERGIVVATGFFDHANAFDTYQTTDGKTMHTVLKWPNSISLMEAFKIRDGKIYRVEAIFTYVPYFMHNPWAGPPGGVGVAASKPAQATPCDRGCLEGLAGRYVDAMVARDPGRMPWADAVRYSENSVPMMIGDGIWATVTAHAKAPLLAADPNSGQVAWMGEIEEHGQPSFMALRLKVEGGKIAEAEAVVRRKGGPPQYGDPTAYAPDPAFEEVAAPAGRGKLQAAVDGYFDAVQGKGSAALGADAVRQDNGVATTDEASAPGVIARVRARRYPIIDERRGVVIAAGFLDLPAHEPKPAAGPAWAADYPFSVGFISAFKLKAGRIWRVDTISNAQPYLMPSPWGGAEGK
jgi:hypothetical protein